MTRDYVPAPRHAIQVIRRMIVGGEVKPGDKLPSQRDLSRLLGLSRPSLREAISTLETLGFVRAEAGRGVFVLEQPEEIAETKSARPLPDEVYQARICVEPEIAAAAAQRIDGARFDQLSDTVARLRLAADRGELEAVLLAVRTFHQLLCEASEAQFLVTLDRFISRAASPAVPPADRLCEIAVEHESILRALEQRDAYGAYRSTRRHILGEASRHGVRVMTFSS